MFQTMDNESMTEWIEAMQDNSDATDKFLKTNNNSSSINTNTSNVAIESKMRRVSLDPTHYENNVKPMHQHKYDENNTENFSYESYPLKTINANVNNRLNDEKVENISPNNRKGIFLI
jgi:hypothetical protein